MDLQPQLASRLVRGDDGGAAQSRRQPGGLELYRLLDEKRKTLPLTLRGGDRSLKNIRGKLLASCAQRRHRGIHVRERLRRAAGAVGVTRREPPAQIRRLGLRVGTP